MTQTMQAPAATRIRSITRATSSARKVFKVFGNAFHVYDESETQLIMYSKQEGVQTQEDIRLYSDETMKGRVADDYRAAGDRLVGCV
jgi:hypothetical protein